MARESKLESFGGRLNNKVDLDDDVDLLQCAMRSGRRRRTDKIGKNSYCHRRKRSMFQTVRFCWSGGATTGSCSFSKMILLPIYLGLLSQVGIFAGGVEGNGEIESCVIQARSSSTTAGGVSSSSDASAAGVFGSNGLGYYSGSSAVQNNGVGAGASGSSGVGGTNNGLLGGGNEHAATAVDPHSMILCQIRTLHPDLDMENLTSSVMGGATAAVDVRSIKSLKLVCNDVLFFESSVSAGQLSIFSDLRDLTIDKCKLTKLPNEFLSGLRHLRKLTINTGNSDWAARSLELEPEALSNVPQLRHLHLGFNHMWNLNLPGLCKLGSLLSLNMTHNLLSDIEDLGLPGRPALGSINKSYGEYDQTSSLDNSSDGGSEFSCLAELKSLDLSFNSIRTLGSRRLQYSKLHDLHLQNNWLEELEDDGLRGLGQLRLLNLSSNRLVALPPHVFSSVGNLRELYLQNNSISAISPDLMNLPHLLILDLSMNKLSSDQITAEAFSSLVRLIILNLHSNELTRLSKFKNLYSLQIIDVSNNLIEYVDDAFSNMRNLHTINLSKNRLKVLHSNMFNSLYVLNKLILDYNQISEIEDGAMRNCTSLQDLSLVGNELTSVPKAISGLQLLKTLDLGENKIASLQNDSFLGMSSLIGLRMVDNQLENIPKGLCDPVSRLRVLNVAQNRIVTMSIKCPELRVLRLDSNRLETIPPNLGYQFPNLLWLNVSQNNIKGLDYTLLPSTLEWINLSFNKLDILKNAANGSRLRVLDASHNRLSSLDYTVIPTTLETLRVNNNNLKHIAPNTFIRSSNLRRIELIGNNIENLNLSCIRFPQIPKDRPLPELYIGGNPFLCDCEMEWLTRMNQLSLIRQYPTIVDLDAIVCRPTFTRTFTGTSTGTFTGSIPLMDVRSSNGFLCQFSSHCFVLCGCCDFEACDCRMTCPNNCSCFHDSAWSSNIVECSNLNFSQIPSVIPMDATEIYLDGNELTELKSHIFIGKKNLRVIYLNNSNVHVIKNKTFNGLKSLEVLRLHDNFLKVLHGHEFENLLHLRELYLHNNLISQIDNKTFLHLRMLEILRLDGNRLKTFSVYQLSLNPYLVSVGLSNPWTCDCIFLHNLYNWATDNARKVVDIVQLQCIWNNTNKPGPHLIDYNQTCKSSSWTLMGIENGLNFTTLSPLSLALVFVSLVTLLILVIAIVVLCRDRFLIFIFRKYGLRLCAGTGADYEDDGMKSYDAYLIYSQKDEDFVVQRISDELETNDNYRICLHYRDLMCENGDMRETMETAVESSKCVLIILSRNFLQGEWSSGEYRSAFHAVLKKSQKVAKTPAIIIVIIEDITKEISPDIRSLVKQNKIKVIRWNIHVTDYAKNRKFFNKLKFFLPDASSHYHSNITSNTTTTSASSNANEAHGGIMATLKYSTTMQNDSNIHHSISHPHHNNTQHHLHHHPGHQPHQQIIVDESGRFTTTTTGGPSQTNTLNSIKYWPYGANFVALPPSSAGSHPPSVNSPGSGQSLHYHPPLPLTNPPKSPPSSQSTDSTTTTMADDQPSIMPSYYCATNGSNNASATKSPVPVPKSSYSSPRNILSNNPVNSPIMLASASNSSNNGSSSSSSSTTSNNNVSVGVSVNNGMGESYLSIEGEHVYSTLDPPSPQPVQQMSLMSQNILGKGSAKNFLNNIHLPNGYTYQPQASLNHHHQQQQQWLGAGSHHPHHFTSTHQQSSNLGGSKHNHHHHPQHQAVSSFVSSPSSNGGAKSFKQKDGNNPVQTYLV